MGKGSGPAELIGERALNEEIAKVAYGLYQQRGNGHGSAFDDWLAAEEMVRERHKTLKREKIDVMSEVAEKKAAKRVAKKPSARPKKKQ